jgi:hygromycin-B 7''-O-kinase
MLPAWTWLKDRVRSWVTPATRAEADSITDAPATRQARLYSARLGPIAPHQFQAALARFDLGSFVSAAPVRGGNSGQNVFVTSTLGTYVLRGRPVYPWQFAKECFGASLLHQRTAVPVAHPYLLDPTDDIFGWPYILMPRLTGVTVHEGGLTVDEQTMATRAMARTLAQVHTLTWPFAGEYDLPSNAPRPFANGYAQWLVDDTRRWRLLCQEMGFITAADLAWTERIITAAQPALTVAFQPCFVMNDYNPGNVLVAPMEGEWRVSGLFDLVEYYFGDGEADLVRMVAFLLDLGRHQDPRLAQAFVEAYFESAASRPGFVERYRLAMVRDRLQVWEYVKRVGAEGLVPAGKSFQEYAERYVLSDGLLGASLK